MSTLSFLCSRNIVRSRKSTELCSSYVGLSFILLCILLMYVLMVCKLIFVSNIKCLRTSRKMLSSACLEVFFVCLHIVGIFRQLN